MFDIEANGLQPTEIWCLSKEENGREIKEDMSSPKRKGDTPVSDEKICSYCKKHLGGEDGIKTLIAKGNNSKLIRFCKFKCFENYDRPKFKKK